jgi:hypothetical protein
MLLGEEKPWGRGVVAGVSHAGIGARECAAAGWGEAVRLSDPPGTAGLAPRTRDGCW